MRRRAQLQTLEPIIIVVILALIVGVVLLFVVRAGGAQDKASARAIDEREAIAMLRKVTSLPELSCPLSETVRTFCIDGAKAQAFARLAADPQERLAYYPLLGSSRINLTWADLSAGTTRSLLLYDGLGNASDVSQSATYFTVYDPVQDARLFATLTIERGAR